MFLVCAVVAATAAAVTDVPHCIATDSGSAQRQQHAGSVTRTFFLALALSRHHRNLATVLFDAGGELSFFLNALSSIYHTLLSLCHSPTLLTIREL